MKRQRLNLLRGNTRAPKYQIGDVVGIDTGEITPAVVVGVSVFISRIHPDEVSYSYQIHNDFWGWDKTEYDEEDFVPVEITPKNEWCIKRYLERRGGY